MIFVQQEIGDFTYDNIGSLVNAYDSTLVYSIGDMVRVGTYQYKSALDNNTNNDPLTSLNIYWIQWSPSNSYALLDLLEGTKTEWDSDGIIEFTRGTKDTIGVGNFKATKILIQYLDEDKNELARDEYNFSNNGEVWDEWSYGYAEFTDSTNKTVYTKIQRIGVYIRITFSADGNNTYCGYIVSGKAIDMGDVLDGVSLPDTRIGTRTVSAATFTSIVRNTALMRKTLQAKRLLDVAMMFVIDPSETSVHDNMIILGKITKCDSVASKTSKNKINWQIDQLIQE
jgi:hypothetical protein